MSRFLRTCAVLCVLAVSSLTVASAQSKNINFHNGWIEVTNRSGHSMRLYVIPNPADYQGGHMGYTVWEGSVGPGVDLNNCCYAAGSLYLFAKAAKPSTLARAGYDTTPNDELGAIRLRLCNRNAIPYGYAAVEIYDNYLVRTDTKCP